MRPRQVPLLWLTLVLLALLAGLWLALQAQIQSSALSLPQPFLLLGGAALGFLVIGIEGLRLAIAPPKKPTGTPALFSIFLLAYILPALLLSLPGLIFSSASASTTRAWIDPLPPGAILVQSLAAAILLTFRAAPSLAAWLRGLVLDRSVGRYSMVGCVCGLGLALGYQFSLDLCQAGVQVLFIGIPSFAEASSQKSRLAVPDLPLAFLPAVLAVGLALLPLTSAYLFREALFSRWLPVLKRPGAVLAVSALFALLHFRPIAVIPAFFLMLLLLELDRLTRHPLPGIIAHAAVNLLAFMLNWRWMV